MKIEFSQKQNTDKASTLVESNAERSILEVPEWLNPILIEYKL
ncbi:MAG: hypothetical protein ACOVSR_03000 [Bacteroidia bacterium]